METTMYVSNPALRIMFLQHGKRKHAQKQAAFQPNGTESGMLPRQPQTQQLLGALTYTLESQARASISLR